MPSPHTAQPRRIPLPVLGLNRRDPLESMDPRFSPWMVNMEPEPQFLRVRNGYIAHCEILDSGFPQSAFALVNYNNEKLFAYARLLGTPAVYDVTTGTPSKVHTPASGITAQFVSGFARTNRAGFGTPDTPATLEVQYDGSSGWGPVGWTDSSAVAIGGRIQVNYRGRAYIFEGSRNVGNSQKMYYSTLGAVTGSCSELEFSDFFTNDQPIAWAGVLTTPNNQDSETLFCFGNAAGEILVYTGDFPSAANWRQVGKFQVSPTLGDRCAIEIKNDIWISTTTGVVSLRRLFQFGDSATEEYSISRYIDPLWTELTANGSSCSFAWLPEKNKVYFLREGYVDSDGTYSSASDSMFVYNLFSQAWGLHKLDDLNSSLTNGGSLTYFNGNIYFTVNNIVMKIDFNGFKDEETDNLTNFNSYDIELRSAYTQLGKQDKWKRVQTVEPVIETDFSSDSVGMKVAADFGRKVSDATNPTLQDGYNLPVYNVGVEGEYLQYRLTGSSDTESTDGFKLYSVGMSINR